MNLKRFNFTGIVKSGLVKAGLELLYPSRANCMGCNDPLGADEGWLCYECIDHLVPTQRLSAWRCQRCGHPISRGGKCRACRRWPKGSIDIARFAYPYRRPVDRMIRRMKYGGVRALAPQMGIEIANMLITGAFPPAEVAVPVPMHPRRLRERGFNHAALIAREVASQLGIEYYEALHRVRYTRQQARLNQMQREQNIKNSIVADDSVKGLHVLLIDDVITSGTTASQCALALKAAGAKKVYVATLAGAIV